MAKATVSAQWDEETGQNIKKGLEKCGKNDWNKNAGAGGGAVYGLGFVGALIYFLGQGGDFGKIILGILKAIVWPAIFVFYLFKQLGL